MSFTQGGGGGRAVNTTENSLYALDKPYDLAGLSADTLQQVNEMFDILFRSMTKAKAEIDALEISASSDSLFNKKIIKINEQDNGLGNTTFTADTLLKVPILVNYNLQVRFGCQLWSSGDGIEGGMKIRLNHSATAAVFSGVLDGGITTLGGQQFATAVPTTAYSAATNSGGQTGFFTGWVAIDNVTVAGNLNIEYASLGAGGSWAARVRRGSWVEYFYTKN